MRLCETLEVAMQRYGKIFDLLVLIGGAHESLRDDFLYRHVRCVETCSEYRFKGALGFGGKYWSNINKVSFYPEDETSERVKLRDKLNSELEKLPPT